MIKIVKEFAFCALCLANLAAPQIMSAEEIRLPLAQSPQAVENLLKNGQAQAAYEIAIASHRAAPNNVVFLITLARSETAIGNFSAAVSTGTKAWRSATTDNLRFAAADIVSKAHFRLGNYTRAQLWLRRAYEFSPGSETSKRIAQDYRTVSAKNPWSSQLRFGAMPTSNVNNGSANETVSLFDFAGEFTLSGDALALSGIAYTLGGDTSYRLSQSGTSATYLTATADIRTYSLSNSAQEQAPDAKGSDYAYATMALGLRHRQVFAEGAQPTDFSFRFGRSWYGGEPNVNFVDVSMSHSFEIDSTNQIKATLSRHQESGKIDDGVAPKLTGEDSVRSTKLGAEWQSMRDNKDRFSLGATVTRSESEKPDSDYSAVALNGSYDLAQTYAGMNFGFGITAEKRDFDSTIYQTGPRNDQSVTLRMSVTFADLEFYGFRPVMNVEAKRNKSNVDLFDRDYKSIGFDLRSSF